MIVRGLETRLRIVVTTQGVPKSNILYTPGTLELARRFSSGLFVIVAFSIVTSVDITDNLKVYKA